MKNKKVNIFKIIFSVIIIFTAANSYALPNKMEFVKAATVYRLFNYIEIKDKNDDLVLCHNGGAFFSKALETLNKGRRTILSANSSAFNPNRCNIFYLDAKNPSNLAKYARDLRQKPVASVSELTGFVRKHDGIVELSEDSGSFNFIINLKKSKELGILLNSKLIESSVKIY